MITSFKDVTFRERQIVQTLSDAWQKCSFIRDNKSFL